MLTMYSFQDVINLLALLASHVLIREKFRSQLQMFTPGQLSSRKNLVNGGLDADLGFIGIGLIGIGLIGIGLIGDSTHRALWFCDA
jgi:hypothetical protein